MQMHCGDTALLLHRIHCIAFYEHLNVYEVKKVSLSRKGR